MGITSIISTVLFPQRVTDIRRTTRQPHTLYSAFAKSMAYAAVTTSWLIERLPQMKLSDGTQRMHCGFEGTGYSFLNGTLANGTTAPGSTESQGILAQRARMGFVCQLHSCGILSRELIVFDI